VPPKMELSPQKDFLDWQPGWGRSEKYREVATPRDILDKFARLADANVEKIQTFARRYGPLGLCYQHSLPLLHEAEFHCAPAYREPIETWRALARAAAALVQLRALGSGSWKDASWLSAKLRSWPRSLDPAKASPARRRELIDRCINRWLACSAIRPRIQDGRFVLLAESSEFPGPNLFGVLAIALAYDISGAEVRVPCQGRGCKRWCELPKNASPTRRHYCRHCRGINTPLKDAQRDLRRKKREAQQLRREGNSIQRIVAKLGLKPRKDNDPVERVRRWVGEG